MEKDHAEGGRQRKELVICHKNASGVNAYFFPLLGPPLLPPGPGFMP